MFEEKYFSRYILLTKFNCLVAFTLGYSEQYVIAIVYKPGYDVMNFEVNLIFLINPFILKTKRAFKMK